MASWARVLISNPTLVAQLPHKSQIKTPNEDTARELIRPYKGKSDPGQRKYHQLTRQKCGHRCSKCGYVDSLRGLVPHADYDFLLSGEELIPALRRSYHLLENYDRPLEDSPNRIITNSKYRS
ncbi:hypothetical protein QE152_g13079 [Popillia japonica]|uniref:Uncharacterized protein n=1 Tax=Popillia japonica TaxID=7064 RepID=A0AAW1LES7_POPJA